ncbi:HAD-like domain containing protein [Rhypophila sp. PSN 637]
MHRCWNVSSHDFLYQARFTSAVSVRWKKLNHGRYKVNPIRALMEFSPSSSLYRLVSSLKASIMRVLASLSVLCSSVSLPWGVDAYPAELDLSLPSLDSDATPLGRPWSFGFVFDIDGVLLRGPDHIDGALAPETLEWLAGKKIPFVMLTNGGGKTEQARVEVLNSKLGTNLTTDNIIQSHTPFGALVDGPEKLRNKTILVTGSDYETSRKIMHNYGYQNVVTPGDIYKAEPQIFTFVKNEEKHFYDHLPPLPKPVYKNKTFNADTDFSPYLKIDAIFILNDVRDWALDFQIISDLLISHQGYLGTTSKKNLVGHWQQDGQPKLYFSNADLTWGATWHIPRYGQGSTKASLEGLWREHTKGEAELISYTYGKPTELAYQYAERALRNIRDKLFIQQGYTTDKIPALRTVYMIGDNPESDIAGPNMYKSENGTDWHGILVRTGIYQDRPLPTIAVPLTIEENVHQAVRFALVNEGVLGVLPPRPQKTETGV